MNFCNMENKEIESRIIDALSGVCPTFEVDGHKYTIHQKTLGKMYLFDRLRDEMGLNHEAMKENPLFEVLRVCKEERNRVLRMLAYATLHGKEKVFDETLVQAKIKAFEGLNNNDLATLMLSLLMDNDLADFTKYFKLDIDDENRKRVARVKKSENTITFGGRSVWGTIIDFACSRYGWTFDHVVWEISYINLMMLYKDKVETAYLNKDEVKKARLRSTEAVLNADDPKNMEKIMKIFSN